MTSAPSRLYQDHYERVYRRCPRAHRRWQRPERGPGKETFVQALPEDRPPRRPLGERRRPGCTGWRSTACATSGDRSAAPPRRTRGPEVKSGTRRRRPPPNGALHQRQRVQRLRPRSRPCQITCAWPSCCAPSRSLSPERRPSSSDPERQPGRARQLARASGSANNGGVGRAAAARGGAA